MSGRTWCLLLGCLHCGADTLQSPPHLKLRPWSVLAQTYLNTGIIRGPMPIDYHVLAESPPVTGAPRHQSLVDMSTTPTAAQPAAALADAPSRVPLTVARWLAYAEG